MCHSWGILSPGVAREVQELLLPGDWGIPQFYQSPPRLRAKVLKARFEAVLVGFASLYPPYPLNWRQADRLRILTVLAVTVQQNAAGGLGVSPNSLFLNPQEWGPGG